MKRILLLAFVMAACGGSGSGNTAVDRNRVGTGSATLLVSATVTVTNSATSPTTALAVDVSNGLNAKVSGATVTIQNAGLGGDVALTEGTAGSGHYTASKTSLPSGDFTLSVVSGTDKVQGVVLGNPGAHAINAPALNGTVTANQPLEVTWTTPAMAKAATVTTRNYTIQVPDTGAYTIPAANNPARTAQRVIITRTNETDLAGGLPGSSIRASVTTTVDPFNVQ
jgi:hypothetical protein